MTDTDEVTPVNDPASAPPGDNQDPAVFWEAHYADQGPVWSGRANFSLTAVTADLAPGAALDLGCGEGGDTAWLAERGWQVTAVDISPTAIDRARQLVADRGVPEQHVGWQAVDLTTWRPERSYDLVSACFLHSPVHFPRTQVLRRAAGAVAPGGHLLVVGHAALPPWAAEHNPDAEHHPRLLSADEELTELDLPSTDWDVIICENRPRPAIGPENEHATLDDAVVLLRRRRSAYR